MGPFAPRLATPLALALFGLFAATPARADGPQVLQDVPEDPQAVYGGTPVATCGWPTTVSMEGSCTGTLVHPLVVVYAAHCGPGYSQIGLGENINSPKRKLNVDFCDTFGGNQFGTDYAFCKLTEPVLDIPIVPILMGCELDILKPGQEVTIVGYGEADAQPNYGVKREVVTTINSLANNEAYIGGDGKDSCYGDSGGPVYVQLADGTWRVFGITSYGNGGCGSGGYYSMIHNAVQWIEETSSIDITPCHNADGSWQPGPDCKGFPMDPGPGGGDWGMGCGGGPVGPSSATCGKPFDDTPDMTAPTVTISEPLDGQVLMGDNGAQVKVVVAAQDVGWGMKEVHLIINDQEVPGGIDGFPPYEFPLLLPDGAYCIGATGHDVAGNIGTATPVCIGVNGPPMPPDPPEPETTTGEDETGDGDPTEIGTSDPTPTTGGDDSLTGSPTLPGGEASTDDPGADAGDEGCGCRSGHVPKDSLLAVAALGLLGLRRRRR
jgi:MYXO-CTERM domain-containing protein